EHRIQLSKQAESLCIQRLKAEKNPILLIAGADERGLSYALLDAARAVELSPKADAPFAAILEAVESPYLRVRSITIQLFNADLEAEWYFDEQFWAEYFKLLAQCRYNNFTLTFSHQTNYLNPLYAFLVDVPGFPQVSVKGLTPQDRERNLAMLKRIAEMAHERGLDFTLGIWTQLPVEKYPGEIRVEHLPTGLAAADYCAAGLRKILETCSAIDAVQFRMNAEAGVSEDQQTDFYRPLFQAIRDCGHPVRVDLRYKGLRPETIQIANDMKLDATVSTKFWCEHMGLPYHPTVADTHYRESRYSFGAMLSHPRDYRVVYQLWSVGTQRLLLWGDPTYAARFAESCRLGAGEGFEVNAPLTDKGFGDLPGKWRIFADKSLEHYRWEHERYWFFYLAFGRLGYNPQANPEVWKRELRARFGSAADDVESAYRSASQILPLVTATHQLSAGEWMWCPEIDTGDRLTEYMHTPPGDTAQFYAIRSWKPTPRWRSETWDDNIPGFVEDAVAGRMSGKTTPLEVSQRLRDLAKNTLSKIQQARDKLAFERGPASPTPGERVSAKPAYTISAEFRATELDLRVLASLGTYHAEKKLAATELAFFDVTHEAGRLARALPHARGAAAAWEEIVRLTEGTYHSNLVFGFSPQHGRKNGHHHSGHWKDRLAEVCEDVAALEKLVAEHPDAKPPRRFPGEQPAGPVPSVESVTVKSRRLGLRPDPSETNRKVGTESQPTELDPAADATFAVQLSNESNLRSVVLHYRPLNQTLDWKQVTLKRTADGSFQGTVSSKDILSRDDFQYFVEVLTNDGGRRFPSYLDGQPYFVARVRRP
ncbi:MAG: hypothetical protein IAG10_11530, partial [Planctomycetaceae bacterium]|nr:hypothetical protein [Planctomycetaceae bacterium]